jgi:hypothetical protein
MIDNDASFKDVKGLRRYLVTFNLTQFSQFLGYDVVVRDNYIRFGA